MHEFRPTTSPGRPRRRSEDNIRMNLQVLGQEHVDRIYLAHDMDPVTEFLECETYVEAI
jgi:hypothetical protein